MNRAPLALLLLLLIVPFAHAVGEDLAPEDNIVTGDEGTVGGPGPQSNTPTTSTSAFALFRYDFREPNPAASRIQGAVVGQYVQQYSNGKIGAGNVPFVNYLPESTRACAQSARLVYGHFDDRGDISITANGAQVARAFLNDGGGHGPNGRVDRNDGGNKIFQSTSFDPQQAVVSWWFENSGGGDSLIEAGVQVTYTSHNGYVWNGYTCSPPIVFVPRITGIRVSNSTPVEGENITVWCNSSIPLTDEIVPLSNDTGVEFAKHGWDGSEQNITASVGSAGRKSIACAVANDPDNARSTDITVQVTVPGAIAELNASSIPGQRLCINGIKQTLLEWTPARSAINYSVYANGTKVNVTNVTRFVGNRSTPNVLWEVAGINSLGQEGLRANVTFDHACDSSLDVATDHFSSAYFARAGQKNVTAFWTDENVVIVYRGFGTDLSRKLPQGALYDRAGNRQIIRLEPSGAFAYWQQYVRSLRVNATS